MKIRTLKYSLQQGFKNIRRNRMFSLASIGTIMACLFLFGIFYFVIVNFRHMVKSAENSVGITVFFDDGVSKKRVADIGEEIKQIDGVDENKINYVSGDEAWERYKESVFETAKELTDTFEDVNPLEDSDSYEIYLLDVSKQPSVITELEEIDGIRKVKSSDLTASSLSSFNMLVGYISIAIIMILVAVAVFLISTTVTMGISVRKDEIKIMRLIGATDFFIRSPFIVEGLIIGIVGAILPLALLYLMYNKVVEYISTSSKFGVLSFVLKFLEAKEVFATLIPISLLLGIGIGFFGSYLTVRKHLRV